MELVKILYKSCLYMDVDLSTAFFHVSDEPISDDPHVPACAMWEGCLASIAEVYTSDLAEGAREPSDVQGPGAPELTRRFSLPSMTTEVQRVVPEAPAPAEPDSACPDKEELHRRASAQSRVHAEAAPGALAESLDDGVLLATFFRSRNTDITALVRGGKIPATVVALNLAVSLRGVSDRWTHGLGAMPRDERIAAMGVSWWLVIVAFGALHTLAKPSLGFYGATKRLEEPSTRRLALGSTLAVAMVGFIAGALPGGLPA